MLSEYAADLEADFESEYGRDLLELHSGSLSLRKAVVLTMKLPPGSRVWQALGGPLAWRQQDYWNSQLFHALNIANWQRSKNGSTGKNSPEPPKPPSYTHEKQRAQKIMDLKAERFQKRMRAQKAITATTE